jgi:hypothetical protein
LSNERLVFGSEEAQKKEVASLVQSNKDLIEIYIKIKNSIDYTNLHTQVPNTDRMISSQITNKRVTGAMRESTLEALSTDKAFMRINRRADEKIEVVPFFDEAAKNKMLKEHYEEMSEIDGVLEVLNATTKLMTP